MFNKQSVVVLMVTVAMLVSACGGGGGGTGGGDTPAIPATSIGGTAAGGSPLVGTITVKDSNGLTKTAPSNASGVYVVDVTGMVSPYLLSATGSVGLDWKTYYSVATDADRGKTVNITPYTSLMTTNITLNNVATHYASNNPSSVYINSASIANAVTKIRAKMASVLTALSLSANTDFMHDTFTADHTGIDALMDILTVRFSGNLTFIDNSLTGLSVGSDQANVASDDDSKLTISGTELTNLGIAATGLTQIKSHLTSLQAAFTTSLPNTAALNAINTIDAANFLHDGYSVNNWSASLTSDMIGFSFSNIDIKFSTATVAAVTAKMTLTNGVTRQFSTVMDKSSGTWKDKGNQQIAGIKVNARTIHKTPNVVSAAGGSVALIYSSGLNIDIDLSSPGASAIRRAVVTGQGLHVNGVTLIYDNTTSLKVESISIPSSAMAVGASATMIQPCNTAGLTIWQCIDTTVAQSGASYTIKLYDTNNSSLNGSGYVIKMPYAPVSMGTATPAMFATLTSQKINNVNFTALSQVIANADFSANISVPTGYKVYKMSTVIIGGTTQENSTALTATATSGLVSFGSTVPASINTFVPILETYDSYGRSMVTSYY